MRQLHLVFVGIILFLLIHIPFLGDAAVFDEPGYLEGVYATYKNSLNPFVEWEGYKPPVTVFIPALLYRIAGAGREIPRIWILILASITLYVTYKLAGSLYDRKTAVITTVLLISFPLFFIQSFLVSDAMPLTFGFLLLLYSIRIGSVIGFVAAGAFMLLSKETAILAYGTFAVLFVMSGQQTTRLRRIVVSLIPPGLFLLWMLLNKYHLGWYVWPVSGDKATLMFMPALRIGQFLDGVTGVFTKPYQIVLTMLALLSFFWTGKRTQTSDFIRYAWIFLWVAYLYIYGTVGIEIRYLLFLYPLLIIYAADVIVRIHQRHTFAGFCLVALLLGMFAYWHVYAVTVPGEYHPEASAEVFFYRDMAKKTVTYVERNFPDATIVGAWPNLAVWKNDPFIRNRIGTYRAMICPMESSDFDYFWKDYDPTDTYIYITHSGINVYTCDFGDLTLQMITEIRTDYPIAFKDTVRIYRILPAP